MIHVECPWCDGPAVVDAGSGPGEGPGNSHVRCEGCGVAIELAAELAAEPIARAA
jgi:hypothetical protein